MMEYCLNFVILEHNIMVIHLYYLNIFFLFSFLGHIVENLTYTNVDSGILFGAWTPIYGIGSIIIIIINKYLDRFLFKWYLKIPLLFIISSFILAIVESIGGYYIEYVFGRIFWSYPDHFIPIGKYTSVQMMILWGFSSVLLIYVLVPLVNRFIDKIPTYVTKFLILLFIADMIYTYSRLANIFTKFFISFFYFL